MEKTKIKVEHLNLHFGDHHVLKDVNMEIKENAVSADVLKPKWVC